MNSQGKNYTNCQWRRATQIEAMIKNQFGFDIPVFVISKEELEDVEKLIVFIQTGWQWNLQFPIIKSYSDNFKQTFGLQRIDVWERIGYDILNG